MSKIIIEIKEGENGVNVEWSGSISLKYIMHMIKKDGGFDKLKGDLCHQLLEMQMGFIEEDYQSEQYEIIQMAEKMIQDLEKNT